MCLMEKLQVLAELCSTMSYSTHAFSVSESTMYIIAVTRGKVRGGIAGEFGTDMYTLLYLIWITNKVLLYNTWDSAPCYLAAWMGGDLGGRWIRECVWLSPFTAHLKLSQHCLQSTLPQYKIKRFSKRRKMKPSSSKSSTR